MVERATVELQRGIWIDQQQLTDAGLKAPLEIAIQSGEIRIRSAESEPDASKGYSALSSEASGSIEAWDEFRSLGHNAQFGRLTDPSTHHDRYLYGAQQ